MRAVQLLEKLFVRPSGLSLGIGLGHLTYRQSTDKPRRPVEERESGNGRYDQEVCK